MLALGPCVVGATGGSGTRVVARIVRRSGLYTGADLNESEDAWRLGGFSDRWINPYLPHYGGPVPRDLERSMRSELEPVLADHCEPLGAKPRRWGWKEPRSIYLLPFFHSVFPTLRFLHVVRDGRDMALSENQNQLRKHASAAPIPISLPPALRSIALWSWINLAAARYGEESLGDRYLRVRFEDLCNAPAEIARAIVEFVELEDDPTIASEAVHPPASLGRWRSADRKTIAELERVGGVALEALGYVTDGR